MKHLVAILLTIASLLGLSACTVESQTTVEHAPTIQHVAPKGEPLEPPTVVTAPKVTLASVEVEVLTTPAPAPILPPAPVEDAAPVQWYPVTYQWYPAQPVQPYTPPQAPALPAQAQVPAQAPVAPQAPAQPTACLEDEPCWDCSTMGNRICGTTEAVLLFQAEVKDEFTVPELTALFDEHYVGVFPVSQNVDNGSDEWTLPSQVNPEQEYLFTPNPVMGDA